MVLRARGSDFRLPPAPAGGRDRYRSLIVGDHDAGGRGRAAVLRAGRRDRHRQAEVMVTIRVPSETRKGGRQQETREFGTTRRELLALADWLRTWRVERAGMESTCDYWKPVLFLLEREGFDCLLYQASQVKALPGRPKTDKLDSAWLAKITEQGSLAGSFVPPEEIRRLRTYTRYRRSWPDPHRAEAAVRKAAGGRHLKLSGDQRHPRRLRPGHAAGDHRRRAHPEGAGGDGPRPDAPQDRGAGKALDCSFFTRSTPSS